MRILITFLLLFLITASQAANANCSTRILKQVCDVCEQRAISKLSTDSTKCPACEPVNCPTASLSCTKPDSFEALLKSKYTLTAKLFEGDNDSIFRINTVKSQDSQNSFSYDVRAQNYREIINDGIGFIFYDIVSFNLPVYSGTQLLSYTCTGVIDNASVIKGYCSTSISSNNETKTYGGSFISIPD